MKILLLMCFLLQKSPIEWKCKTTENVIIVTAIVQRPWHIFSQDPQAAGSSTSFNYNGEIVKFETTKLSTEDTVLGNMINTIYQDTITFIHKRFQPLKSLTVTYQVCNDHQCMPPTTIEFK